MAWRGASSTGQVSGLVHELLNKDAYANDLSQAFEDLSVIAAVQQFLDLKKG